MGWGNKPKEKLYPMPWETCDYIYDHKVGLYVPVNYPPKKQQPSPPTPKVKGGNKDPRSATCGVKKRTSHRLDALKAKAHKPHERKKNAGLTDDDPSGAAVVIKKEELDAAAASPKETPTTDEAASTSSTPSTPMTNTTSTTATTQSTPTPEPTAATKPKVPDRKLKPEIWRGFTPKFLKEARERNKKFMFKIPGPPMAVRQD